MNMNGLKVITQKPDILADDINYLIAIAQNDESNRLKQNYTAERFLQDTVAVSIAYETETGMDIPISMSCIQERPIFNGMCRILSRFYRARKRQGLKSPGPEAATVMMVNNQLEWCKGKDIFISREDPNHLLMKRFAKGLGPGWKWSDKRYWVCNGAPESCAQYVIWKGELWLSQL